MTPIHEMKTRMATWVETTDTIIGDVTSHGVFFEVDCREVGVVIRDQPEEVAKPLIEAIAALPMVASVLRQVAACKADRCAQCKRQLINLAEMLGVLP